MNEAISYKKKLLQKSLWLFAGRGLPIVVLFIITILYSRRLSYNDYGTFQSVWMYANIISIIISYGFSSVIFSTNLSFLFSFLKRNIRLAALFYTALWLISLTIFYFISKNFTSSEKLLVIAFIIVQNIITVGETLLVKRGKEKTSFIINIFYSLLFLGWHLLILFSNYSLFNLIAGITIVSIAKLAAMFLVPVKKEKSNVIIAEKNFLQHWNFLGLNEIFGVASRWIDKLFLLYLLTASDFAIFFNGSFEIPLFGLLISVAGSLMLIELSANSSDKNKIQNLFRETFNLLSSFVFPLFLFLLFFRHELFYFIFKNKYNDSIPIFTISNFVILIRINNYSSILQTFSQGKKIMMGSVIDIVIALLLMIILYPFLGSRGIALAMVIATYCQVLYYLFHSARLLHIKIYELVPIKKLLIKFIILLLLYLALFFAFHNIPVPLKLFAAAVVTLAALIAGLWNYMIIFFKNNYV